MPLSVDTRLVHIVAETPPDGDAATGDVIFLRPFPLVDGAGNVVSLPAIGDRRYVATLGETDDRDDPTPALESGEAYIALPVNDQVGVTPQGWSWTVAVRLTGWRDDGYLTLASGGTDVEFSDAYVSDAAPVPSADETYAPLGALQDHVADTSTVHGIADTATLVTAAAVLADDSYVRGAGGSRGVEGRTPAEVRSDLSLGGAALLNVGTTAGTVAAGDDARLSDTRTPTDNSVTSAKIVDGAIVNADINAAAAIALSKLATDPLARANHTGTQPAASISDFDTQVATTAVLRSLVDAKGDLLTATAADTPARLAVGTSGHVLTADPAASTGLVWRAPDPDQYTAGMCWPPRHTVTGMGSLTSGGLRLEYFTAPRTESWTAVATVSGTTGAGATPTLCRMGVYSVAANGDLTLVASCASDTTLWATPSTRYSRSLSVSYAAVAGQRYAIGVLITTGVALPTLMCADPVLPPAMLSAAPRLAGVVTGQTDLPASVAAGSITDSGFIIFGELLTA